MNHGESWRALTRRKFSKAFKTSPNSSARLCSTKTTIRFRHGKWYKVNLIFTRLSGLYLEDGRNKNEENNNRPFAVSGEPQSWLHCLVGHPWL